MSADVESWTCAMHGITTMGDCPRCDDELIASAERVEATGGEGVTLTEAERKTLNGPLVSMLVRNDGVSPTLYAAVERIVAARIQQAEAERDALRERVEALRDDNEAWVWTAPVGPGNASYANGYENGRRSLAEHLTAALDGTR